MANPEHVELVKQGAEAIRKWREEKPRVRLDLDETNLGEADLGKADLSGAHLNRADLHEAKLVEANSARLLPFLRWEKAAFHGAIVPDDLGQGQPPP